MSDSAIFYICFAAVLIAFVVCLTVIAVKSHTDLGGAIDKLKDTEMQDSQGPHNSKENT